MGGRFPLLLLSLAIAGCSLLPGERPTLGISNGTTLAVQLFVNGERVVEALPGRPTPDIDESRLPPLPWTVEARTVTGRVLVSMTVDSGDVTSTVYSDGHSGRSGTLGRVDLSCGRLDIYAGPPAGGPPPGPGVPGDCVP
jgi:hypothetical protein